MNLFVQFVLVLLTSFLSLFFYFKRCYLYWEERGVYVSKKPHLIFGNVLPLLIRKTPIRSTFKEIYDDCQKNSEKMSGFYFFTKPCLVITDLDLIKQIMQNHFLNFTDRIFHNHESDPLSEHLVSLKGLKWKQLRGQLSPAFTFAKTKMMFQSMIKHTDEYVDILKVANNEEIVDIQNLTDRFSIDTIGDCAFGIDCNCLKKPNSPFQSYVSNFFSSSLKDSLILMLTFIHPEILYWLKVRSIRKDIGQFFLKIVSQQIKFRKTDNITRPDFLNLLMQIKNTQINQNGDGFSNDITLTESNITANSLIFFMAGYKGAASTILFCLYELSVNPDIQSKARQNVIQALSQHNGAFSYDAVKEMDYIEKCIKETLRKYVPSTIAMRECTVPYKVPNTNIIIEKGTSIFVPVNGIHMDSKIFPDPERFDPERFSRRNTCGRHSFSWIPFGAGPRMCIGVKFAMLEMKICIAKLIRSFEFSPSYLTEIPVNIDPRSFFTWPKNNLYLRVKQIN